MMMMWPQLDEASLTRLSRGTYLVLSVLRGLARGREPCVLTMRAFAQCCGTDAGEVVAMLRVFLVTLADGARRRMSVAPPGWRGLTAGERQVLGLIGAAQGTDGARLDDQVSWSARHEAQAVIRSATLALAATLAAYGLRVSPAPMDGENQPPADLLMSAQLRA